MAFEIVSAHPVDPIMAACDDATQLHHAALEIARSAQSLPETSPACREAFATLIVQIERAQAATDSACRGAIAVACRVIDRAAPVSNQESRRNTAEEATLSRAQAILNMLMVARDLEPRAASNAAWAASDLLEDVLCPAPGRPASPASDRDMIANNLCKAAALSQLLMAAKDPAEHWRHDVSWSIADLVKKSRAAAIGEAA